VFTLRWFLFATGGAMMWRLCVVICDGSHIDAVVINAGFACQDFAAAQGKLKLIAKEQVPEFSKR
jgi:hypothetical protein